MPAICRTLATLALGVGLICGCRAVAQQSRSEPFQIHIARSPGVRASKPIFRIELQNSGDKALILNLGIMGANGRSQYADAIRLLLRDARGKAMTLELIGPAIAPGRTDPMVVPLPAGATFTLPIDLAGYWAP